MNGGFAVVLCVLMQKFKAVVQIGIYRVSNRNASSVLYGFL
jgi:hypothetical protein